MTAKEEAERIVEKWKMDNNYPDARYLRQLKETITEALESRDEIIAECVNVLRFIHTHSSMGLVRGGEGPAIGFLEDVKKHSSVLLRSLKEKG